MRVTILVVAIGLLASCSPTPPPTVAPAPVMPFRVVATVKQVMKGIVEPASNALFAAAGEAPKDDAGWQAVEYNALAVVESANLLMMDGRAIDQGEWMKHATAMMDKAMVAVDAARAKDAAKLGETGDALYSACEDCHKLYLKAPIH
ncbi:MAG TPA: hypothetical protein VK629_15425 [Steroidobacteraceae bacterium]|nr:hypothetical protein [Steroidobacteraceae bacterium]